MTQAEAKDWVRARLTDEQFARAEQFVDMVIEENQRQNLISPASIDAIWVRHVVDSLQLLVLAGSTSGRWLDIGTGGGFPGMVLAIAGAVPIMMVEPRRKRAEFLAHCINHLGIAEAQVSAAKVEHIQFKAEFITARAVASTEKLLRAASHCATTSTRWLLPRGMVDAAALSFLSAHHMVFHVEHSLTHAESAILVIDGRLR